MKAYAGLKKNKKTVAVIFGGKGAEHDISVLSGKFVMKSIDRDGLSVLPVFIDRSGDWYLKNGKKNVPVSPVRKRGKGGLLRGRRFVELDAAFPILHGDFGEDGRVQGLLEALGIPFVGCDTQGGALAADKVFTKALAHSIGIPTLPWLSSAGKTREEFSSECERTFGFPIFIKPARLGSSIGAGAAKDREGLEEKVRAAYEISAGTVMAEPCLCGARELECAYLRTGGKTHVTPPGEIRLSGDGFYCYEEKYGEKSRAEIFRKADVPEEISDEVRKYSEALCLAAGIKGIARIDFFLHGEKIYFNEINTMPGMTEASLYPAMIEGIGITPTEMITGLVKDVIGGAV